MTVLEISALIAVIIFAILAGVIIWTLIPLRRSIFDVEKKLKTLDPLIQDVAKIEEKLDLSDHKKKEVRPQDTNIAYDLVEWALLSLKLGDKLINRR